MVAFRRLVHVAARRIQTAFRAWTGRLFGEYLRTHYEAARAVQTAARGFLARRVFLMLALGTHANARSRRVQTHAGLVALQAAARRRAEKARYEGSLLPQAIRRVVVEPAALLLTRVARAALAKAEIAQRRRQWEAATEVQRFARGKSARLWRGVVKRVMVSAPLGQTLSHGCAWRQFD